MQKWKAFAIALPILCFAISFAWFAQCIRLELYDDAGRGGAIGVAFSFAALFLLSTDRYHSIDVLDESSKKLFDSILAIDDNDPRILIAQNSMGVSAIKNDLRRARIRTRWENYSLSVSSVISTGFWGFGDLIAKHFFLS